MTPFNVLLLYLLYVIMYVLSTFILSFMINYIYHNLTLSCQINPHTVSLDYTMKINRLLEIVYILLRQKTVTARQLAERFNVSQRTIYRDIDTLSLSGIPVYTEQGKGGGISLLPEFVLNKSILSEQEQKEILTALQGMSITNNTESSQVLKKLSAIFNKSAANWLEIDFSDWSSANGNLFNGFKTAILERRIAEFDYYGAFGDKTHRRVEPIQLWFKSRAWYLKAYCLIRQDMRLFKLIRVRNLVITDNQIPDRDLLANQPLPVPDEHLRPDVNLKLKIAPQMTHRIYEEFNEDMLELRPDGSHIVTVTWLEDEWMYGRILSFGEFIEVLKPEHVRKAVRERSRKIMEKYD